MTDDPDLLAFLRETVRSVWALELLLLLRRTAPRAWSPAELVGEMRASTGLVADNLQVFETSGLVRRDEQDRYAYDPPSAVLARLCDQLDTTYRESPVRLINAIASPAADKLKALADAFRFKGDGK